MSNYSDLKNRCLKANIEIKTHNLAIFTFGNVSVIDREKKVFAIKPSGVLYNDLTEDKIVVLDLEGNIIEGDLRASSDTKTHLFLYNQWEEINSICHTHSTYAVGWAQSLQPVPIFGTTHADHLTKEIPCTEPMEDSLIKGDYEIRHVDFSPKRTSTTIGEASGYIPSEAQKNDPRFSYALTKDVRPDTMKKGAKAMGLGNIQRDGRPPLLRPGKKKTKNAKTDFGKGIY